ncbi:hypothetical protein BsWGS_27077 [Bradybaena similaris]
MSQQDIDRVAMSQEDLDRVVMSQQDGDRVTMSQQDGDRVTMSQQDGDRVTMSQQDGDRVTMSQQDGDRVTMSQQDGDRVTMSQQDGDRVTMSQQDRDRVTMSQQDRDRVTMSQQDGDRVTMSQRDRDRVAIIGVGCKFPGADNLEEFWRLLENGENHVIEIPDSRWLHESVYDNDFNTPAKTHARKAGLLKDHLSFDNKLFNIKDVEADIMDPQQRYVLECCHRALEDAGITRDQIKGSNTSVYMGAMSTDYRSEFTSGSFMPDNYAVTGLSNSIISNRVSYIYDLRGSSVTIDTACSSSLVAIDWGIQALRAGKCDLVICGGVNSILSPDLFVHLSKARMVSAKGQCFAFSDQVDGYTRGEGCGVVILKRLRDAIRDENNVWATIETGCNQDGGTVAPISKPSGEQQVQLLQEVWAKSAIDPKRLTYIEAHGTGTPVGDVVEARSFGTFFQNKHKDRSRFIGSVKTNIGHLESAAGVAGLIKVLLMMKHSKIVPSLHFQRPNPDIDFEGFQLKVPTGVADWRNTDKVASVSSYGFGGTNCYAIIESHQQCGNAKCDLKLHTITGCHEEHEGSTCETNLHTITGCHEEHEGSTCETNLHTITESREQCEAASNVLRSESIVCFSGMTLESLRRSMTDFVNYPNVLSMNIEDLSLTSTVHRDHFPVRQAFVANTTELLRKQVLGKLASVGPDSTDTRKAQIVFVCSGMGTAWTGMGRDLMSTSRTFRDKIRDIDKCLSEYVSWTVEDRLTIECDTHDEMFWPIAIFAFQVATAHIWKSLGVVPDCVIGYSVGEVAAAHVAGRLTLSEAVRVIYHRTRLLARLVGVGRMLIFRGVDIQQIEEVVNRWPGKANVATKISPKTCGVSGEDDAVVGVEVEVRKMAREQNLMIDIIDLKLPLAYHSHCVDGCKEELRQALNGVGTCPSGTPVDMISTVTGDLVNCPLTSDYWVDNIREPVLSLDAIRKSSTGKENIIYIEVGSKPLMASHIEDIFPGGNVKVVVSMRAKGNWKTFLEAVGKVYKHGCSVNWKNLPQSGHRVMAVPRYSFNTRKILRRSESISMTMAGVNTLRRHHPFVCRTESTDKYKIFLSAATFQSVFDHIVAGSLIVPGALYVETAFAISRQMVFRETSHYSVTATFGQPCRLSDKMPVVINLDISTPQRTHSECPFKSYRIEVRQQETRYATLQLHPRIDSKTHVAVNIPQVNMRCPQTVDRITIYNKLEALGFNFGPLYKLLHGARRNAEECIVNLVVPDELFPEIPGTTVHPSILDAMLQSCVVLTEISSDKRVVFPISIGKVTPFRTVEKQMCVYTKIKDCYGKMEVYDSKLTTLDGDVIVEIEELTVKYLSSEAGKEEHGTENISRSHWVLKVSDYPFTSETDPGILYISNEYIPSVVTSIKYSIDEDSSDTVTQQLDILARNRVLNTFRFIIFDISAMFDESAEATAIQSKIINLSLALKSVFCFPLKIPVYVFTRWALPAEYSSSNKDDINPVMTSVWGLVRSALQEENADIFAFDLHMPHAQCCLHRLTSVSNFVHKSDDLKRFSEWMVTENKMFVNENIQLANNIVATFRYISADQHKHVLHVSTGPLGSTETFCVYDESERPDKSEENLEINVNESVLLHPKLFNLSVPYSTMVPHRSHLGNGSVVFVLETTGKLDGRDVDGIQQEVIACYPSPMGSHISVPAGATLPRDMFGNYSRGDLTRLSVLMALSAHVAGTSITILTSSSTRDFSQLLCGMLAFKDGSQQTRTIECVSPDELQNGQGLNLTVVSLVLLDDSLVSILSKHWPQAEHLITVAPLLCSRVKSLVNFYLPEAKVIVMDPSEIFQPRNLLELIPQVKEFLSCNRSLVSKCLSGEDKLTDRFPEVTADLDALLKVQAVKVNRSSVRVDHNFLFKKDAVYIVVGGLTGLGWTTVRFLASQGAGHIAILNRRAPGEDRRREINNLSLSTTCSIQSFQCDVCNTGSFSNFLNVTSAIAFPNKPLKGIFYGAAVEGDASLINVTREHLLHVMSPKIVGAWNAHILTENEDLDYFVLQSSVTSVIGNFGQTAYGAANAFLDGLASYRRHRNLAGQSINWGPLTVGMLENNDKAVQSLTQRGMNQLTEEEIQSSMNHILLLDFGQIIACKFDHTRWRKNQLSQLYGSSSFELQIEDELRKSLQTAPQLPQQDRIHIYMRLLVVLVAHVLGIDEALLHPDSALQPLGMDSLLAMSIRNEVFKVTQHRMPAVVLVSGDVTVRLIAEKLDAEIQLKIQGL